MKKIIFLARLIYFILLNLAWPLLKKVLHFEYLFLVYPGSKKDYGGYYPKYLNKIMPIVFPIGFINRASFQKGVGLILATPTTTREFLNEPRRNLILEKIRTIQKETKAKSIALAGQFPGILIKKGMTIKPPFVAGEFGAVFAIYKTIETLLKKEDFKKPTLGIIGIGYIGEKILSFLNSNEQYKNIPIIAYDIKHKSEIKHQNILLTNRVEKLTACDLVILLTSQGNDLQKIFSHLKQRVILIDDTHPLISADLIKKLQNQKKAAVYKVVLGLPKLKMFPRLPNYESDWIPGCVIEAIIAAKDHKYKTQKQFNQIAENLGFYAHLVPHKKEII